MLQAGDLTEKFWSIRTTVGKYLPLPPVPQNIQNVTKKANYGRVNLDFVSTIFNGDSTLHGKRWKYKYNIWRCWNISSFFIHIMIFLRHVSQYPINFEALNQSSGFMIYETKVTGVQSNPVLLSVPGVRDRATVFVDQSPIGVLSRLPIIEIITSLAQW